MRMRLFTIATNVTIDQPADAKTHTLSFRPVAVSMGPGTGVQSSLTLSLTAAEASGYVLGGMYDVGATLAANQQPQDGEPGVDAPLS